MLLLLRLRSRAHQVSAQWLECGPSRCNTAESMSLLKQLQTEKHEMEIEAHTAKSVDTAMQFSLLTSHTVTPGPT